jgi:hypothetical protein
MVQGVTYIMDERKNIGDGMFIPINKIQQIWA